MGWQSRSLEIVQITTGDQCVGAECVLGKEVGAEVRDLVTEMVGQMTYIFVEHTKDFGFDDGGGALDTCKQRNDMISHVPKRTLWL